MCAVPPGLIFYFDSPGTAVPGYRLYRRFATASSAVNGFADLHDNASSSLSISPISLNTDGDTRRKSSATLTLMFVFLSRSATFAPSFMVKLIRAEVDSGGVAAGKPGQPESLSDNQF